MQVWLFYFLIYVELTLSHHLHYYLCNPPNECAPLPTCHQPLLPQRLCGFGAVCCLNKKQNNTPQITDAIVGHKNFHFLPLEVCGMIGNRFRITSGSSTFLGEFPWMALLAYKTTGQMKIAGNSTNWEEFKCGGTVITKSFILTAAHCVHNMEMSGVRLGEFDLLTEPDCDGGVCAPPCQNMEISKILVHEFYNSSTYENDVALIKLEKPADFTNENVRPVCLPFGGLINFNLDGKNLTVAGWGTTEKGDRSTTLRKVSVPVVPTATCRQQYTTLKPISNTQICAGGSAGHDSCAGDSGGPLFRIDRINRTPRYVQYGVVSFGPSKCGLSPRPGVYTDLRKYLPWILNNLE